MDGMTKIIAALFLSVALPCYGEVLFDWKAYDLSRKDFAEENDEPGIMTKEMFQHSKSEIKNAISEAALKYKNQKYASLGAHHFLTSSPNITTSFKMGGGKSYYLYDPAKNTHHILFSSFALEDLSDLKRIAVHEFSHAYDTIIAVKHAKTKEERMIAIPLYSSYEERAREREYLFHSEEKNDTLF